MRYVSPMPLTARDIMQTKVVTVTPDMSLSEVSDLLFQHRITGAPVVEKGRVHAPGGVLGVISRSDLVRFPLYQGTVTSILSEHFRELSAAQGETSETPSMPSDLKQILSAHTAREAMAMNPVCVSPDTPVREVAQALVSDHLHRALVLENEELVGLISALDIVGLVADNREI